jgi:retinol-binding protein 3
MRRSLTAALVLVAATAGLAAAQPQPGEALPDMKLDAATRTSVIDNMLREIDKGYVFPEVGRKMDEAIRRRVKNKEYDGVTSARKLAEMLTANLQEVSKDKHLRVGFSPRPLPVQKANEGPNPEEKARQDAFISSMNYGFERVERLEGNVGYIDLRMFSLPAHAGDTVAAAMTFLGGTDSIIIDLRKNGGGMPEMVALLTSYFYGEDPVHLNDLYFRPANTTQQYWTHSYVPGRRHTGKDLYILTSKYTFSAAEEFTYNLKNLKRATIIGETTGGGAHPGDMVRLDTHFSMFLPNGRAINPISKTNWEGTGVIPDIKTTADEALKTAHLMAVKKRLDRAKLPEEKQALEGLLKRLTDKK